MERDREASFNADSLIKTFQEKILSQKADEFKGMKTRSYYNKYGKKEFSVYLLVAQEGIKTAKTIEKPHYLRPSCNDKLKYKEVIPYGFVINSTKIENIPQKNVQITFGQIGNDCQKTYLYPRANLDKRVVPAAIPMVNADELKKRLEDIGIRMDFCYRDALDKQRIGRFSTFEAKDQGKKTYHCPLMGKNGQDKITFKVNYGVLESFQMNFTFDDNQSQKTILENIQEDQKLYAENYKGMIEKMKNSNQIATKAKMARAKQQNQRNRDDEVYYQRERARERAKCLERNVQII